MSDLKDLDHLAAIAAHRNLAVTTPALPRDLLTLLAEWIPTQRWFAGKDLPISGIEVLAHTGVDLGSPGHAVLHHLVVAVHQPGRTVTYQVPVAWRPRPATQFLKVALGDADGGVVYDALHDPDMTAVLAQLVANADAEPTFGELQVHREPDAAVPVGQTSRVFSGEQSNTTLAYGTTAILKVFRRLNPGLNPDIEVHDALTRDGCPFVAPLFGWIDGTWHDPGAAGKHGEPGSSEVSGSLAMMQALLAGATDGWQLALTSLRDLFADDQGHPDELGADFAAESTRLGAATAHVHASLARSLPSGHRDQAGNAAIATWMRGRLDRAAASVQELAPYADSLRAAYADLAALPGPTPIQRVHGDYHLGQVMRAPEGWKLLDFEGEPSTALDQRTALDSPVRDVAGMLRSYDYASRHLLVDQPDNAATQRLVYRASEWSARNRSAFCAGYAEAAGHDPRADTALLRAYEIDKAVYEVVYEAHNRPTWLPIPMAAVERLSWESVAGSLTPEKGGLS